MSTAHRFSVAALAVALVALSPSVGHAQEQQAEARQAPPPLPAAVPLSADERRKFVGDYDVSLPDGRIMGVRVFVEEEQLMLTPEEEQKTPMRYIGSNTFGIEADPSVRLVFDVANGKVTGGKVLQHGMTMNVFRRP